MTERAAASPSGVAYTAGSYLLWGVLPLYFLAVAPTGAFETVAWRIIFSLIFCALLLTLVRGWKRVAAIARDRRLTALIGLAGVLVFCNWQIFVLGTQTGHVVETSLGYFINPILTVLLGVVVLRERLRPLQWAAVAIAALAVGVIVFAYGSVPWIALGLAFSFGLYGLVKHRIGPRVDALSGLTLETVWLVPIAVIQLVVVGATSGLTIGTAGAGHTALIVGLGVVTAVPLLLFAAGTRRVPLSVVGILQFMTPIMQFLTGVFLLHEPMPPERWVGFGIVWIAVVLFVIDALRNRRRAVRG